MRRWLSVLVSLVLLFFLLPISCFAREITLASEAAVLMDGETGQILYSKNMDEQLYPASITKVMTALVALKHSDPSNLVTMTQEGVNQVPRTSSHIALLPGEEFSMEDALYALALVSANDAAVAIAETVGGTVEKFCDMMNEEAVALGAVNTHFSNPNGLPAEDHYTTAQDMALITAAALQQEGFLTYFGAKEYVMPATNLSASRELVSKNQFIDGTVPCDGLLMSKTGWTSSAWGTLVTAAKQGETTLVAVTLKSAMLEDKYADTAILLDYGFTAFRRIQLTEGMMMRKMTEQGLEPAARLEAYEPINVLLPIADGEGDIAVTVPGGFDGSIGLSAVPVSIDAKTEEGDWLHIADLLLSIEGPQEEKAELLREEEPGEETQEGLHPGVILLLSIGAMVLAGYWGVKRKEKV